MVQPSSSPYTAALQLLVELLRQGQKTIVFTKARRITELLYSWLRQQEPALAARVASYRAGFLPEERRAIEASLLDGRLQGVTLHLGARARHRRRRPRRLLLVGWPGSVMATWQRSGRVGRTLHGQVRESLTALVALPDALDQWVVRHPEELLARPCEPLVVDPGNEVVARQHLPCAAAEMPLERGPDAAYLARHAGAVTELLGGHELRQSDDGERLSRAPATAPPGVAARRRETFAIVQARGGRVIAPSTACASTSSATPARSTSTPDGSTWCARSTPAPAACWSSPPPPIGTPPRWRRRRQRSWRYLPNGRATRRRPAAT